MSYTRSYHNRIAVHYSGSTSVSYPASQSGGMRTVQYSGTVYEDVYTNILVDTDPLDRSVSGCRASVNTLTGAVVATESAQIASIRSNAQKVGATIVDGFFKTIRSEISQQISELSSRLNSTLMHLHEMAKRCTEKQKQMEADYVDISARYQKIFGDLNRELSNRIYELNKPAFVFKNQSDSQHLRSMGSGLVSDVTIFGAEGGNLQAHLSTSIAKRRALDTINKANIFLLKQKRLDDTINQSMLKESANAVRYSPVCFIETHNRENQADKKVCWADFLPEADAGKLIGDFQEQRWGEFSEESSRQIGRYFNAEVNNRYSDIDPHTSRVRDSIVKMLNFNQIKSTQS